jgi:hypothetical protein
MSQQFLSLNNVITGTGEAVPLSQAMNARRVTAYVAFALGSTAGVVRLETAHREDYAGVWSVIADVDAAALTEDADHILIEGPIGALRGRVTTTVSGGGAPGVTVIFILDDDI